MFDYKKISGVDKTAAQSMNVDSRLAAKAIGNRWPQTG